MKLLGNIKLIALSVAFLTTSACSMKDRSEVHSISVQLPQQWTNQSNNNFMIGSVSSVADFDCYALNVTGPGIINDTRMGCTNPETAMGMVAGFVPVTQGVIDMMVPAGPSRKIQVIGIQSNISCQILDTLLNTAGVNALTDMGVPYVIGTSVADVFEDTAVNITVAYDPNAIAFQNCGNSNVPPTLAITTPNNNSYINTSNNTASFAVSGTCNRTGQPIDILVDAVSVGSSTCIGGSFSANIDVTGFSETALVFSADMTTVESGVISSTSVNVTKDSSAPNSATALAWGQASPHNNISISASWTKSTSPDLASQTIQFYSDSTCTTALGTHISLSSSAVSNNLTGANGNEYSYLINSFDTAGNSSQSSCSTAMTVDTIGPVLAITVPTNNSYINTSNNSISYTVSGFCSDNGGTVTIKFNGGTLGSTACAGGSFSTMVDTTGLAETVYTITAEMTDAATNFGSSNINVTKDTTGPTSASALSWIETSPSAVFAVNTTWVKSGSADLTNQKIMYYVDGTCTAQFGGYVDLSSNTLQTHPIAGTNGDTRTFKILSIDTAGNETLSSCSTIMSISAATLVLTPSQFDFPVGQSLSQQFAAVGGSETGYTYSIQSGPGTINSATGFFTAGSRMPNTTTTVRVTDLNGTTNDVTIKHVITTVNGIARTSVNDATHFYVGGAFTAVHPYVTNGLMSIDETNGLLKDYGISSGFNGGAIIKAVLVNGDDLYVGGTFKSYQGTAIQNLAKIKISTGRLDTNFTQNTGPATGSGGIVNALAISGGSLYLGGNFTMYRGDSRGYMLAKVDTTTGNLETISFNTIAGTAGGPNNMVNALAISGSDLFVAGGFTQYRTNSMGATLAKVDTTTGLMNGTFNNTSWTGGNVHALTIVGPSIFAGGNFPNYRGNVNGATLVKINMANGVLDGGFNSTSWTGATVYALANNGSDVFVGGNFTTYRGSVQGAYLTKASASTGIMDNSLFNNVANINAPVYSLAFSGPNLIIGGEFADYRADKKGAKLAKVDPTTGNLETGSFNTIPSTQINGSVYSIAADGTTLFIGGTFTNYRGTPAQNLAKFEISTGLVDNTFTQATGPGAAGTSEVTALLLNSGSLYVGGNFTNYRGNTNAYMLAKLDTFDGTLNMTFNSISGSAGGPNNTVYALASSGSALFVGGIFNAYRTNSNGKGVAKVDLNTGVLDTTFNNTSWAGGANVYTLLCDSPYVYIGGNFTTYRGVSNGASLAKVDEITGSLETGSFNTTMWSGATVNALALNGGDLFIGGNFLTYRGDSKGYHLAKVSSMTGVLETALFNTMASNGPNVSVNSLVIVGGQLYIGGMFSAYRGDSKGASIAKLDLSDGTMDVFTFNSIVQNGANNAINFITPAVDGLSLYIGGSYTSYRNAGGSMQNISISTGDPNW
jgi:hypothetical protein